MLVKSYYGPGTSLFYPMAPAAATGMPLTAAHSPFGPAVTVNGAMPSGGGAANFHHAHNFAALAAAQQSAVFHLAAGGGGAPAGAVKTSVSPAVPNSVNLQPSGLGSSPVGVTNCNAKLGGAGAPAAKKFRPAFTRPSHKGSRYIPKPIPQELGNLKTYSSPDILICGNCREMFNDLVDMMEHKRDYCKLRFTCKCDSLHEDGDFCSASGENCGNNNTTNNAAADPTTITINNEGLNAGSPASSSKQQQQQARPKWLHCVNCKSPFGNAWDLMVHVQTAHMMNIYQLADSTKLQNIQRQRASVSPSTSSVLSSSPLSSPVTENSLMPTTSGNNSITN